MYYQQSHDDENERQFNLPGYLLGQIFNPGGGQYPGQYHGGAYPGYGYGGGYYGGGYPGYDGNFPGYDGGQHGGFPGQPGNIGQNNPPSTPPPPFTPQQPLQTKAIDPGAIRGCRFRFTYVWMRNDAFWFYPTFIGRNSISGFRWRRNRWVYYGVDLNQIEAFQCF